MLHLHEIPKTDKSRVTESRPVVARCWGKWERRSYYLLVTVPPLRVMEMVWNWREVMVAQHHDRTKHHSRVHIEIVNVMLCEFHLNL